MPEGRRSVGSFGLGLRVATALSRAGELNAALRSTVELLVRELAAPALALRPDPFGEGVKIVASSGLSKASQVAMASAARSIAITRERARFVRDVKERIEAVLGGPATILDCGACLLAIAGSQPELELCGRELASLLVDMPVADASLSIFAEDEMDDRFRGIAQASRLLDLTPREREILAFLASGAGTAQIARRLVIAENTVKTHVQNILRKLDVTSRLEAAALAIRAGFLTTSAS